MKKEIYKDDVRQDLMSREELMLPGVTVENCWCRKEYSVGAIPDEPSRKKKYQMNLGNDTKRIFK